jgi:5-methylcytosine-specific restriction endonuclease McrA
MCGTALILRPSEQRKRFCSRACWKAAQFKNTLDRTYNGRPVRTTGDGYVLIWEPDFGPPSWRGWALEHRVVMAKALGRTLLPSEEVDHINSDRQDNRPENLQVLDKAAHRKKTGADTRKRRMTLAQKVAAYEAKYGPLME